MNGVRKFAIIAVLSGLTALNVIPYKTFAYDIPLKKQTIKENSFQFDHKTAQVNPQSVANYPCDNFSINAEDKISPDVPKTEEEKKQFELANPPNPGLVTYNYLYRSGDVPDAARLARVYGVKPEDWNEHRTPGFIVNGRKVYLRWFRNQYSVVDYEYKFVAECYQKPEKPKNKNELTLTKATTTDAQSVTVDYTIEISDQEEASQPIHFEIYRSPVEDAAPATQKIGEQDISDPTLLSSGKHNVKLISGTDLKPNTAFPYVVVVATYNGKKSTTYFQKWMLGAISHGFNRYDYIAPTWLARYAAGKVSDHFVIPDWEILMAEKLKSIDKYDDVIEFNWTSTSGTSKPGLATEAGTKLREKILDWISIHRKQHTGDVVDIHLIGHSRGTVVVTQALVDLVTQLREIHLGSYIQLTLLDPHPANNKLEQATYDLGNNPNNMKSLWDNISSGSPLRAWISFPNPFIPTIVEFQEYVNESKMATINFQNAADDPAVEIPSGVKKIDIWYQKTLADNLVESPDEEWMINLWGLKDNAIHNNSGVPIELGKNLFDLTTGANVKPAIGHNEVPDVYEKQVVETGNLNRSE
ncbi:hypothetical protein [Nostoc sp.]|uniref:hypothetical protein n=1 Tax=Nostoc sp. TaxID=1180 RepID=UPI002FF78AE5